MNAGWTVLARPYEDAARAATGMAVRFLPGGGDPVPVGFRGNETPLCALLRERGGCPFGATVQRRLLGRVRATGTAHLAHCPAGLAVFAVPVPRAGGPPAILIGGHVFDGAPRPGNPRRLARRLAREGIGLNPRSLDGAWRATPRVSPHRLRATLRILESFGRRLAEAAARPPLPGGGLEPRPVAEAKGYVAAHFGERIRLAEVARFVHLEPHYFCRVFRRGTGIRFGDYVARRRVEEVKTRLADPGRRISEVALDCGFGSIPHFNRVFRRVAGASPSEYRARSRAKIRSAKKKSPRA